MLMLQCTAIWIIRTIFAFSAFIPPWPWENVMCSVGCLRDFGELWFTNTSNIYTTLNPLPVDTGIISTATTDNLWRGKTLFICLNGDPADKQQSWCILLTNHQRSREGRLRVTYLNTWSEKTSPLSEVNCIE